MSRLTEHEKAKRERLIREYARQGFSANLIQRRLSEQGLGMRRKELLRMVKRIKSEARPKAAVKISLARAAKPRRRRLKPIGKRLAIYGTVDGESRRIELSGSGRELYLAMLGASQHPPRERFLVTSAKDFLENEFDYLDLGERWDEHPEAES
ncbi:MAG: hypothetical protein QW674_07230 [Candidatus Bathyarchaeia archaeon]